MTEKALSRAGRPSEAVAQPHEGVTASVKDLGTVGIPSRFSLLQNYPNPFNPGTTMKFELPTSPEVRLSIVDIPGREVTVLVSERRDAGVHEVAFDGSGLASGFNLYRLTAGSFVETRKPVLVR